MVQGLAFLSKKSWHTKNLANQEKVWMAEQQKAAEESKTKELARQIQQEREQEELDRISGKKSNRLDRGIDWMYQGGAGEAAEEDLKKQNEEFLLGKEYVPEGGGKGGDFSAFENTGISTVVASAAAHSHPSGENEVDSKPAASEVAAAAPVYDDGPSVADRNESFRMRHEDPMFLVSQKQNEKKNQIAKKKALYEKVVGETTPSDELREERKSNRKRHKELKKDRKRERKHHRSRRDKEEHGDRKRRRRSRSRSRERSSRRSDDRDSYHRRSHRSRSPSEEHRGHDKLHKSDYYYSSDDDYRKDYRSRRDDRDRMDERHHYRDNRHHHERRDRNDERRRDRDGERRRDRNSERRRDRDDGRSRGSEDERRREHNSESTRSGYGLQGASKQWSSNDDLGPNRELLAKKRQEQEAARRQAREKASRRQMTDAEREEALRAMQSSANRRDAALSKAASYKPKAILDDQEEGHSGKASFLTDVAKRAHGIQDGASMSSRVAQNRHTNQNVNDSFL